MINQFLLDFSSSFDVITNIELFCSIVYSCSVVWLESAASYVMTLLFLFGLQIQAVEFAARGASIVSCGSNLLKVIKLFLVKMESWWIYILFFTLKLQIRFGTAQLVLASLTWD